MHIFYGNYTRLGRDIAEILPLGSILEFYKIQLYKIASSVLVEFNIDLSEVTDEFLRVVQEKSFSFMSHADCYTLSNKIYSILIKIRQRQGIPYVLDQSLHSFNKVLTKKSRVTIVDETLFYSSSIVRMIPSSYGCIAYKDHKLMERIQEEIERLCVMMNEIEKGRRGFLRRLTNAASVRGDHYLYSAQKDFLDILYQ